MPKRVKHRKVQRGNLGGLSQRCNELDFGDYGLQSLERIYLTANQIEAARVAITRHMKRRGIGVLQKPSIGACGCRLRGLIVIMGCLRSYAWLKNAHLRLSKLSFFSLRKSPNLTPFDN